MVLLYLLFYKVDCKLKANLCATFLYLIDSTYVDTITSTMTLPCTKIFYVNNIS